MAGYAEIGIEEVHMMPFQPDPVALIDGRGEHVMPRIAAL
jgi:hypothetical protein